MPALTTLRVPRYEIGRRAGEMICARLAGRELRRPVVDIGYEFVRAFDGVTVDATGLLAPPESG